MVEMVDDETDILYLNDKKMKMNIYFTISLTTISTHHLYSH